MFTNLFKMRRNLPLKMKQFLYILHSKSFILFKLFDYFKDTICTNDTSCIDILLVPNFTLFLSIKKDTTLAALVPLSFFILSPLGDKQAPLASRLRSVCPKTPFAPLSPLRGDFATLASRLRADRFFDIFLEKKLTALTFHYFLYYYLVYICL